MLDETGLISTQLGRGTYIWEAPSEEAMLQIRKEGLEGMTRRYIIEARRQGYAEAEIRQVFERVLNEKVEPEANE